LNYLTLIQDQDQECETKTKIVDFKSKVKAKTKLFKSMTVTAVFALETKTCCFVVQYLNGFGNEFSSEDPRCPGALPKGQVHFTELDLSSSANQ